MTTNQSPAGTAAMQAQLDGLRAGTPPSAVIGRIETHTLASGQTIGVPPQPTPDARSEADVLMAINAVRDLDQTAQAVAGNMRLSDAGKAEDLAAKAAPFIKRIAAQWVDLDQMEADAQTREDAHYAVPQLMASNAVGAIIDSEIRSRFSGLSQDDRGKVVASMRGGQLYDVAVALLRSPFPTIDVNDGIRNAWKALMDERAPVIRAAIDNERANVRWARMILQRVAAMAVAISGLNKVQIWRALAPNGAGADLYGFDSREVMAAQAADTRAAAQAASSNALAAGNA